MNWPQYGFYRLVLGLGVAALALEGTFLYCEWRRASRAVVALVQKTQERERLTQLTPSPSEANLAAIKAAIVALTEAGSRRQAGWFLSAEGKEDPRPNAPVDSLIAHAQFSQRMRKHAAEAGVLLRADERFGFDAYVNQGPPAGLLADIHRQQAEAEILVEALLGSGPREMIGLQRGQRAATAGITKVARDEAAFAFTGPRSLRLAGVVETDAMQIEFSGATSALRRLLNALVATLPLACVRSVVVEPLPASQALRAAPKGDRIEEIRSRDSRFTVIVEFPRPAEGGGR